MVPVDCLQVVSGYEGHWGACRTFHMNHVQETQYEYVKHVMLFTFLPMTCGLLSQGLGKVFQPENSLTLDTLA